MSSSVRSLRLSVQAERDERTDEVVLIVCGIGLFAAHARFARAAGVVRRLLALKTKHLVHNVLQNPF